MLEELLRRNLDKFEEEKDEKEKEMLRIIIIGQVNRGEKLLEQTPPGTPSSDESEPDWIAWDDQPSRADAITFEGGTNWYWCCDEEKIFEMTPVPYNVILQVHGILIVWSSGDYDEEMRAHFLDRDVQSRKRCRLWYEFGHLIVEDRERHGDSWSDKDTQILECNEHSDHTGVFIYI